MKFLIKRDFYSLIQQDNLNQIIEDDNDILARSVDQAVEEVKSYIRHRYDVDLIFVDVVKWNSTDTFTAGTPVVYPTEDDVIYQVNPDDLPVAGESPDTNPDKWIADDPRNNDLTSKLVDIVLYHLHSIANPRTIPELRLVRYDGNDQQQRGGAIGWLKGIQKGHITPDLPEINSTDKTGYSIQRGGFIKQINSY